MMQMRTAAGGLIAAIALLAGCAGTPEGSDGLERVGQEQRDTGAIIAEQGAPRARARVHTELAGAYYERGNMGVALEELRIAISADPAYAPAYNVLALVHTDLRENAQAEANFEHALRLNATDSDVNHNYGWFLCRTDRDEQSLRYFMAAVRNPLYATPQKSYALAAACALRKNRDQDALDYFERALRLDPNYLTAIIGVAQIRYKRGQIAEARTLQPLPQAGRTDGRIAVAGSSHRTQDGRQGRGIELRVQNAQAVFGDSGIPGPAEGSVRLTSWQV